MLNVYMHSIDLFHVIYGIVKWKIKTFDIYHSLDISKHHFDRILFNL